MDIRESILVEILTRGTVGQAEIEEHFRGLDVRDHIQWLVEAALLERSGSADSPMLARGKRLRRG
jgi:hypothetical protein